MTPNIGQGANMAIEDAAVLTNLLRRLLIENPITRRISDDQVDTLLRQYRNIRYDRTNSIYRSSRFLVRFQARDDLLKTLFGRYYAPYAGDLPADMASKTIAGGEMCDFLPAPKHCGDGWEKYKPNGKRWSGIQMALFVLMFAILYKWVGQELRVSISSSCFVVHKEMGRAWPVLGLRAEAR